MKELEISQNLKNFLQSNINVLAVIIEPTANGFSLFIEFEKIDKLKSASSDDEGVLCVETEEVSSDDDNHRHIAKYSYGSISDLDENITEIIRKIKSQYY